MSTTVDFNEIPKPKNACAEMVYDHLEKILLALPQQSDPKLFATMLIVEANGLDMSKCGNTASAVVAAFNAAAIGLPPGSAQGWCFFVPRKGKVNLEMGYRGMLELSYGCNWLKSIETDVVLKAESDTFQYCTDREGSFIMHDKTGRVVQGGSDYRTTEVNVSAAYCIWTSVNGGRGVSVIPRDRLDAVHKPKSTSYSPWGDPWGYVEMARKSTIRVASKGWPRLSWQMARAVMMDEMLERGADQAQAITDEEREGLPDQERAVEMESIPEGDTE